MGLKNRGASLMAGLLALAGCSVWFQDTGTVLVREPSQSSYSVDKRLGDFAREYWEYIALAANAYALAWPDYEQKLIASNVANETQSDQKRFTTACRNGNDALIPTPDWYAWPGFPSRALSERAEKAKLFFSVWERRPGGAEASATEVAIVFRGTEADQRQDWLSNARWFIPAKLKGADQYGITRDWVAKEFEAQVQARIRAGELPKDITLLAIGHSLGGGLAQQLAYALPRSAQNPIRVSRVIAFNSSPVTGWFSTPDPPREENTDGLKIDRIFEHGEALAYIRLPINILVPPNGRSSAVRDVRFNLEPTPGGISNHGSHRFACLLAKAAGAPASVAQMAVGK